MRIMLVINSNLSGGAERVVSVLSNYFAAQQHQVVVVNFDADSDFYQFDKKVQIIKLAAESRAIKQSKKRLFRLLKTAECLWNVIKKTKPVIVIPFLFDAELFTCSCSLCISQESRQGSFLASYSKAWRQYRDECQ